MSSSPQTISRQHRSRLDCASGRSRRHRLGVLALGILALAAVAAGATSVRAESVIEVENLRIGFGGTNSYKVGEWTPVWVQIRTGATPFSGFMDLVVPDDDGIPTTYRQPVEMGPKQSQRLTAYARPGGRDTEFRVRMVDSQGRRIYEAADATLIPNPPIA